MLSQQYTLQIFTFWWWLEYKWKLSRLQLLVILQLSAVIDTIISCKATAIWCYKYNWSAADNMDTNKSCNLHLQCVSMQKNVSDRDNLNKILSCLECNLLLFEKISKRLLWCNCLDFPNTLSVQIGHNTCKAPLKYQTFIFRNSISVVK